MTDPSQSLATPECQCCGFDLSKTPAGDPCPECGAPPVAARSQPGESLALLAGSLTILLWTIPLAASAAILSLIVSQAGSPALPAWWLVVVPGIAGIVGVRMMAAAVRPTISRPLFWLLRASCAVAIGSLLVLLAGSSRGTVVLKGVPRVFLAGFVVDAAYWAAAPSAGLLAVGAMLMLRSAAGLIGLRQLERVCARGVWLPIFALACWALTHFLKSLFFLRLFPEPSAPGQPANLYHRPDWSFAVADDASLLLFTLIGLTAAAAWGAAWRIRVRVAAMQTRTRRRLPKGGVAVGSG